MLLREITIRNLLSFGPETKPFELRPLNVLIGPNGSGKSNLIESVGLLQSASRKLAEPVQDGGGIRDWLWKGGRRPVATIDALVENRFGRMQSGGDHRMPLRHVLSFTDNGGRFELIDERIENGQPYDGKPEPYFFYRYQNNRPVLKPRVGKERFLRREDVDPEQSILSQRKDPDTYPEISYLGKLYGQIRLYRDWSFGRYTIARQPQRTDGRNDFLEADYSNLALMLNLFRRDPSIKSSLLTWLDRLYGGIDDIDVIVEGSTIQVFFMEKGRPIPATRLSDGTLRYLCLLVILLHAEPPPLICIEEPELGLHPDTTVGLAELLKEASERTQLIVTTHSTALVDCFTDSPEAIVVCEKDEYGGTTLERLDPERLKIWLKDYSLANLWTSGEIGGNRW